MVPVPDGGKFMICLIALIMVPEGIPELLVQVWYASRHFRSRGATLKPIILYSPGTGGDIEFYYPRKFYPNHMEESL